LLASIRGSDPRAILRSGGFARYAPPTMTSFPDDLDELQRSVRKGGRPKFVLFWGHTPASSGVLGKECFSQWYPAPFVLEGERFATAEHYMMWSKAKLFEDDAAMRAALAAFSPSAAKAIGRGVRGFDDTRWNAHRFAIVVRGTRAKFEQHPALLAYLLGTGNRVLVEASPVDRIWGIGLAADDERAENPLAWRGQNLLGFALMRVRAELAASG